MKSSPKLAMLFVVPARKPSPNPTSSSSDPTPQAIPNIVRKERSLCVHMARSTSPKLPKNRLIIDATNISATKFLITSDVRAWSWMQARESERFPSCPRLKLCSVTTQKGQVQASPAGRRHAMTGITGRRDAGHRGTYLVLVSGETESLSELIRLRRDAGGIEPPSRNVL